MTETDDDTQPMAEAFAATGRALAGEEPASKSKATDLPSDAPGWLVDLTEKIDDLDKRVAQREEKHAKREAAVERLIDRIETLEENIADLEKTHL